jgi:hypothetical protein
MDTSSERSLTPKLTLGRNVTLDLDFISCTLKMPTVGFFKMLVAYSTVAFYSRNAFLKASHNSKLEQIKTRVLIGIKSHYFKLCA